MVKKRRPTAAGLLSLLRPGLGHVYAGDLKKGMVLIFVEFATIIGAGVLGLLSTFYGFVAFILLGFVFYIYVIVSSVRLAVKNNDYHLQAFNRWYWYLAIFVVVVVFSNALIFYRGDILGYETFNIPARSMQPTLEEGDYILVNTRYDEVKVGDVAVFRYPHDKSIDYVKRVVAVGGDTISIDNGVVIRNGVPENSLNVPLQNRLQEYSYSMRQIKVPKNEVFFLGDWRDNSSDSRVRGTVPKSDVRGKVTYIWFSKDANRIGKSVE